MSIQFGGGEQEQAQESQQTQTGTTQVVVPTAPGSEELIALNTQLAKQQLAAQQKALTDAQAFASSPLGQRQAQLEEAVTNNLLARINGTSPVLSPEAQARIDTVYGDRRAAGLEDINRVFRDDASMRGLNVTDSPVAGAKGKALSDFLRGMESAKAASALSVGDTEANFNQQLAQFQAGLRQQAALNRLALTANAPASYGLQNSLFQQSYAGAPRTTSGNIFGTGSGTGSNSTWGTGISGSDAGGYGKAYGGNYGFFG